jgi:propanol-preferring alcohol dehydrogenase
MRAAVLKALREPLIVEEVADPRPGPGEVVVETRTCGLCGTDLHLCNGLAYVPRLPHILGHEPAGVVAELGEGVSGVTVGQRVVPHLFVTCGVCEFCRAGQEAQCRDVRGILGVLIAGALAERFVIPAVNLVPLPDSIPFAEGGLIADAVLTALHASRRSRAEQGESALVIGAGGVGQSLIQILKAAGVRVAAVDLTPEKQASALALGAAVAVTGSSPEVISAVREFAGGRGVDVVFDCVGWGQTMDLAADCVRRCGRIVVVGEEPEFPRIDTIRIAQRELEIIGSRNGSRQDLRDAVQLVANGVVRPRIARVFPLNEINQALAFFRGGCDGRVVIAVRD